MATKHILVTGDFVLDNHIYEGLRRHYADKKDRGVHLVRQMGGAALVDKILKELLKPKSAQAANDLKNHEIFEQVLQAKPEEKELRLQQLLDELHKPMTEPELEWKSCSSVDEKFCQSQTPQELNLANQAYAYWRPFSLNENKKPEQAVLAGERCNGFWIRPRECCWLHGATRRENSSFV